MRGFQGFGDLLRDWQRFVEGDGALRHSVLQRRAFDEFQDQRRCITRTFQAVDVGNVGVVQGREDFGLALEPGEALRVVGERVRSHLDRHVPVQRRVVGAVDLTHPAGANRRDDGVVPDGPAGREGVRHGGLHAGTEPTSTRAGGKRSGRGVPFAGIMARTGLGNAIWSRLSTSPSSTKPIRATSGHCDQSESLADP